jgi:hypothetical protein
MPALLVGIQSAESGLKDLDHIRPLVMWESIDESFELGE